VKHELADSVRLYFTYLFIKKMYLHSHVMDLGCLRSDPCNRHAQFTFSASRGEIFSPATRFSPLEFTPG
jgi:hypothetical protein